MEKLNQKQALETLQGVTFGAGVCAGEKVSGAFFMKGGVMGQTLTEYFFEIKALSQYFKEQDEPESSVIPDLVLPAIKSIKDKARYIDNTFDLKIPDAVNCLPEYFGDLWRVLHGLEPEKMPNEGNAYLSDCFIEVGEIEYLVRNFATDAPTTTILILAKTVEEKIRFIQEQNPDVVIPDRPELVKQETDAKADALSKEVIDLMLRFFEEKPEAKRDLKLFMETMLEGNGQPVLDSEG
jgi:hypothetical protein